MKTKKLLSLILSVIMIMSVLPMYASAADPIALTADNITVYPTANGSIYFGQKINEGVTLSGGEVQYDGAVVAGHFEFDDPEFRPTSTSTAYRPKMIFVPDDTDTYTTFEVPTSKNTTFAVNKAIPVFVDENDTVPVATEVEAGAKISTSTLSGAKVKNPYYEEEPKALAGFWRWTNTSTVVNESGYYQARMVLAGYEVIYVFVLVRIKGDTSEVKMGTTIEELPTIDGPITTGNKLSDLNLIGGKAVGMNGEELSGTFSFETDFTLTQAITRTVSVLFTPDDERYAATTGTLRFTVEPGPIKFVDENGDAIVPEITVPYGTKVKDLEPRLRTLATNCNETLFYDLSANDDVSLTVGTHTLEVLVATYKTIGVTPNYLDTTLTFKVIVEPKTVPMRLKGSVDEENTLIITTVNSNDPKPQGTYDVYVDGELYAEKVPGKFTWAPEKSGEYNFRVVYNPIENDPCLVEEFTYQRTEKLSRVLTRVNTISEGSISYAYGTEVTLTSSVLAENFGGWRITDANGNEVDLGVDTSGAKITFTMPDFNITVEAIDKSQSSTGGDAGDGADDDANNGIFGGIWSFFQKLINWFMNIIKQMMSLFAPKA